MKMIKHFSHPIACISLKWRMKSSPRVASKTFQGQLTLAPSPAATSSFTSLAFSWFVFHCSICNFDLHVKCAFLPETVNRDDHEHPFTLFYTQIKTKLKKCFTQIKKYPLG
uniref:DC1 domain-containing protein n=1 Tax=Davidia involucrata TaxID=16924 RepID=A0A5B7BR87_DAVIN